MTISSPSYGSITKNSVSSSISGSLRGVTEGFDARELFLDGESGALYLPSVLSSLYQESGKSTPVADPSDPVGAVEDQSVNTLDATQSTSADRPIYGRHPVGGIRNELTYTEDLDNAAWDTVVNGTGTTPTVTDGFTDPDGGSTAWRLQANRGAGDTATDQSTYRYLFGSIFDNPHTSTISIYAKSNTGASQEVYFRNSAGAGGSLITVTTTWQRFTITGSVPSSIDSLQIGSRGTVNDDNAVDILIWHPQFELSGSATAYQKVTNQYDVTEAGVRSVYYLSGNGANQYLTTGVTGFGTANFFADSGESWFVAGHFRAVGDGTIIAKAGATAGSRTFEVLINSGDLDVICRGTTNTAAASSWDDGDQHSFLINWDGSNLTGYFDSLASTALSVGAAAEETGEDILIGARVTATPANFYDGGQGTLLFGDKSLSGTEIANIMKLLSTLSGSTL